MHLGLDFDNTIVNYDKVFHKIALEKGLISDKIPISKIAVRDFLREENNEHLWTELQGYVYGARMSDADVFPGVIDTLHQIRKREITVSIVSHKTQYPYTGTPYDLHRSARIWIESVLGQGGGNLINIKNVFFQESKEDKIRKIKEIQCDFYVDDLPEILLASTFPENTIPILFDPVHHYEKQHPELLTLSHWDDLQYLLENT